MAATWAGSASRGRLSIVLRGAILAVAGLLSPGGSHVTHAAGLRCFDNLPVRGEVRAGQGDALIAAGHLDVTRPPYRADRTGLTDAAPALQRAITDGYEQDLVVHLPKGTYLVGAPLVPRQIENFAGCGASNRKHGNQIVGDATGGGYPVLKAKAGAFVGVPLLTMRFEGSLGAARHYVSLVRGLTIDMGANPCGHGLSLEGARALFDRGHPDPGRFRRRRHRAARLGRIADQRDGGRRQCRHPAASARGCRSAFRMPASAGMAAFASRTDLPQCGGRRAPHRRAGVAEPIHQCWYGRDCLRAEPGERPCGTRAPEGATLPQGLGEERDGDFQRHGRDDHAVVRSSNFWPSDDQR